MEYQVPQFIEVEDKIIGPLTLKQFIYIAGAIGVCVASFIYLPFIFALLVSAPVVAFAAALAFYKVNGKPFIAVIEAGFSYYTRSKLFLWKHEEPKVSKRDTDAAAAEAIDKATRMSRPVSKLTSGKLSELAWSLDVKPIGGNPENLES